MSSNLATAAQLHEHVSKEAAIIDLRSEDEAESAGLPVNPRAVPYPWTNWTPVEGETDIRVPPAALQTQFSLVSEASVCLADIILLDLI